MGSMLKGGWNDRWCLLVTSISLEKALNGRGRDAAKKCKKKGSCYKNIHAKNFKKLNEEM